MAGSLKKTPFVNEHWIYKHAIWIESSAAPQNRGHQPETRARSKQGGDDIKEEDPERGHIFIWTEQEAVWIWKEHFYTLKENKIQRTDLDRNTVGGGGIIGLVWINALHLKIWGT